MKQFELLLKQNKKTLTDLTNEMNKYNFVTQSAHTYTEKELLNKIENKDLDIVEFLTIMCILDVPLHGAQEILGNPQKKKMGS